MELYSLLASRDGDACELGRGRPAAIRMKLLLVQNSLYYPAHGGGNKSNRLLLEALSKRGHLCRVVTRVSETLDSERLRLFLADLESRSVSIDSSASVHRVREHLVDQMDEFNPDWTLLSTDDPLQIFLSAALDHGATGIVYLARTTLALPFGPDTALPSEQRTENLRRVAGIVAVSNYVKEYIERWGKMPAVALPISLHGDGPFPNLGRFGEGFVTMVNPCAIKGISIFLELARLLPRAPFAAVPMWGTNEDDLQALEDLPNVTLLPPVDDINKVLAKTRVLLAPSLCHDAKPRIVFEAMSRGVPVIASDTGGVPEAMLGMDYVLPVRPITSYQARLDSQMVPKAHIPEQDVKPWRQALERLLTDRAHYEQLSRAGHEAANEYARNLTIEPFENWLEQLAAARPPESGEPANRAGTRDPLHGLSPEKRALLLMRLRNQRRGE